ncbi:MAG: mechanosensitive ion channel family protein, partial [Terriglobales bacterium]
GRAVGTSLLASAGLAGLALGIAMRPTLASLVAGLQIALTNPIRLNDEVIVEDEWGTVEEITSTYVAVRLWDLRHMILSLSYFIEHPFQNWTRTSPTFIGAIFLYVDYTAPVGAIREEMERLVHGSPLWNGGVCALMVTEANDHTLQLRVTADAAHADKIFALRCHIREGLVHFLQQRYPQCRPKTRTELSAGPTTP